MVCRPHEQGCDGRQEAEGTELREVVSEMERTGNTIMFAHDRVVCVVQKDLAVCDRVVCRVEGVRAEERTGQEVGRRQFGWTETSGPQAGGVQQD